MKNDKTRHAVLVIAFLACTAVIIVSVLHMRSVLLPPVEEPQPQAAVSSNADVQPIESRSEPQPPQTEPESEYLPPIEYDGYTPSEIDPQSFVDTIVLGNSQAQAMENYGLLKNADFSTRIGLSIHKVLSDGTASPPISDLYGKQYRKAVFVFGENELGWPYPDNFIYYYKQVIEKVRELNPGIEVYCQAVFPVTAAHSAKDQMGVTNENVRRFNVLIEDMCAQIGATFMPAAPTFFDSTGALPEGAATDGVHFGYDYCKIWAGDLSAYLRGDDPTAEETAVLDEGVTVS